MTIHDIRALEEKEQDLANKIYISYSQEENMWRFQFVHPNHDHDEKVLPDPKTGFPMTEATRLFNKHVVHAMAGSLLPGITKNVVKEKIEAAIRKYASRTKRLDRPYNAFDLEVVHVGGKHKLNA